MGNPVQRQNVGYSLSKTCAFGFSDIASRFSVCVCVCAVHFIRPNRRAGRSSTSRRDLKCMPFSASPTGLVAGRHLYPWADPAPPLAHPSCAACALLAAPGCRMTSRRGHPSGRPVDAHEGAKRDGRLTLWTHLPPWVRCTRPTRTRGEREIGAPLSYGSG